MLHYDKNVLWGCNWIQISQSLNLKFLKMKFEVFRFLFYSFNYEVNTQENNNINNTRMGTETPSLVFLSQTHL